MPEYAEIVARLQELGCSDEQIERFDQGADSVRDVFEALDGHGEIRSVDLRRELDYSHSTISRAVHFLKNQVGIADIRPDPTNARRVIYAIEEATPDVDTETETTSIPRYPVTIADGGSP